MAEKGETEDQSSVIVNIKTTKEKLEVKVAPGKTVKELKSLIKEKLGDNTKGDLCLIFSGKILKDDDTLESHGINKDGLTIHLVVRAQKTTPTGNSSSTVTTTSSSSSSSQTSSSTFAGTNSGGTPPLINPFGMMGGMPPPGDMQSQMQQLFSNPEVMQQIMESPLMQNLMSNPDALQSVLTTNPQIQQLMERNPELSHILHNPDLMRQAMEMARNPAAMREMMRSQDRQLSNIESLPGGFNALARMYSEIQEPMMDAAQESLQQQIQNNPFSALFSGNQVAPQPGPSAPPGTTNTAPLPNPWQPSNGGQNVDSSRQTSNTSSRQSSGTGNTGIGGGGGAGEGNLMGEMMRMMQSNPEMMGQLASGQLQGRSPLELMQNPSYRAMYEQMLQNPQYRQMLTDMMSNPQMMQTMMQSMPGMQNLAGGMDMSQLMQQSTEMMNNPQLMQMLTNPEAMQAIMGMAQNYSQLLQAVPDAQNVFSQTGTSTTTTNTSTTTSSGTGGGGGNTPNEGLYRMMQMLNAQGGGGGGGGGGQSEGESQEEAAARRYRVQLDRLSVMGFPDRAANIQALIDSGGDINAAIDSLISS